MAVDQLAEKISATGLKVIKQSFACIFSNSIIYIYIYIYIGILFYFLLPFLAMLFLFLILSVHKHLLLNGIFFAKENIVCKIFISSEKNIEIR